MQIKSFSRNDMRQNIYLLWCEETNEAVIIDAGCSAIDEKAIASTMHELTVKAILLTHGHFDHIIAVEKLRALTGAEVFCHASEQKLLADPQLNLACMIKQDITVTPCKLFNDGDTFQFGNCTLKVLHTPGHTPGGICYYHAESGSLFTGDTLFKNAVGRTDLPLSDEAKLKRNISTKLFTLPGETKIYPGHGYSSTIEAEKQHNK